MALLLSMVMDSTVQIDRFADLTIDKAQLGEHFYSDKAPGQAFLAYPSAFVVTAFTKSMGRPTDIVNVSASDADRITWTRYYKTVLVAAIASTSALFTAAAAASIFILALRLGASYGASAFASLTFGIATPAFGWGSVLFGHGVAGGALLLGFLAVVSGTSKRVLGKSLWLAGICAGIFFGIAVVTEYVALPAVVLIVCMGIWRLSPSTGSQLEFAGGLAIGGLPFMIALASYNYAAFGSVVQIGYGRVVGFDGMQQGFFGISAPKPLVLYEILIGLRRGIVWLAPTLVFLPYAWYCALRLWDKPVAITAILVTLSYLLINAGYYYWDGGFSTGPRHIIPALPFMCLALAPLWDSSSMHMKWLLAATAVVGALISIVCASTTMAAYLEWDVPLFNLVQRFLSGRVHNVMTVLGVGPAWSLLPQVLVWVIGLAIVVALGKQARESRDFVWTPGR